jgi:hypothetical protein
MTMIRMVVDLVIMVIATVDYVEMGSWILMADPEM